MDDIKSIVHQLMQKMSGSMPSPQRMEEWLKEQWTPEEQKHIRLIGIKDNTAAFAVDVPAWIYHFESQKPQMLKKFQTFQPDISSIRFKLGKIA